MAAQLQGARVKDNRPGGPRRAASRKENWLEQLQGVLFDLLTCRDTGDDERRPPPQRWWACAEAFESVCDGGASESPACRRRSGSMDMGFLEVGAGLEWASTELPRELTDKAPAYVEPLPTGLGCATSMLPPPPPVQPGPPKTTAEPQPPRAARINTSQAEMPPVPPPARPLRLPAERPVRQLGVARRLGPSSLSSAVPAKLGDLPAPSFQVVKTTGNCVQRAEPLSVSGVSTTSGSASLPGATAANGGGGMILNILLQGERWVAIHFTRVDDLDRRAADFVQEQRLSSLIKAGLAHQLRQMVAMRQLSASVDVVDLL